MRDEGHWIGPVCSALPPNSADSAAPATTMKAVATKAAAAEPDKALARCARPDPANLFASCLRASFRARSRRGSPGAADIQSSTLHQPDAIERKSSSNMASTFSPAGGLAPALAALLLLLLISSSLLRLAQSMSSGAPSMACANLRPLHGFHLAKPASASQFYVSQSALSYKPGENITVELQTQSSERHFRGFILQAYDPSSGSQIGHFHPGDLLQPIDNCSAATHRDSRKKERVSLLWSPSGSSSLLVSMANAHGGPSHRQVRFRASVVVSYDEFYTGFESSDQQFDKFDYAKSTSTSKPSTSK